MISEFAAAGLQILRGVRRNAVATKKELQPSNEQLLQEARNYLASWLRNPETLHMNAQVANAILVRVLARLEREAMLEDER